MTKRMARRRTELFAAFAGALLIAAFPFYYTLIRSFTMRKSGKDSTAAGELTRMDRVDLYLEHELNRRLRGVGLRLYRLTGGRIARLYGAPADVLLLTTHGRKTGLDRTVTLQSFPDGASLIVVAANSGLPSNPDWYYNAKASPLVRVELNGQTLQMRAEELSAEEAIPYWTRIRQIAPSYERYQKRTTRAIPLIRLIPVATAALPSAARGIPRPTA